MFNFVYLGVMFSQHYLLVMARVCYGCLPGIFDCICLCKGSIVIIISPLSALIKDHVETFRKKGVTSAYVSSDV